MDMDKRSLLAGRIPGERIWLGLSSRSQRTAAEAVLDEAIDVIADQRREPDDWESLELRCAIDAFDQRLYATALTFVARALRPVPEHRGLLAFARGPATSIAELRAEFARARRKVQS